MAKQKTGASSSTNNAGIHGGRHSFFVKRTLTKPIPASEAPPPPTRDEQADDDDLLLLPAHPHPHQAPSTPTSAAASPRASLNPSPVPAFGTPNRQLLNSVLHSIEAYDLSDQEREGNSLPSSPSRPGYHHHSGAGSDSDNELPAPPSSFMALPPRVASGNSGQGRPNLPRPPAGGVGATTTTTITSKRGGTATAAGAGASKTVSFKLGGGNGKSSGSHLSDSDDGMEREEQRLKDRVNTLKRQLDRGLPSLPWSANSSGNNSPTHLHPSGSSTTRGAGGPLYVNPVLFNPSLQHASGLGSAASESEVFYDDYHPPAAASLPAKTRSTKQQQQQEAHASSPPSLKEMTNLKEDRDLQALLHRRTWVVACVLGALLFLGGVGGFFLARSSLVSSSSSKEMVGGTMASLTPQQLEAFWAMQEQQVKWQQQQQQEEAERAQKKEEEEEEVVDLRGFGTDAKPTTKKVDTSKAVVLRPPCPCEGVPLFKILWGRFRRTLGRLKDLLDKGAKHRGRRRMMEEEGIGIVM